MTAQPSPVNFGQGVAIGRGGLPKGGPFSLSLAADPGMIRVQVSENGDVEVTQGGMVTHLPYSGGI